MAVYYNIDPSGDATQGLTVELLVPNSNYAPVNNILLTNVHATADATVTLFIQDDPEGAATRTYNIIHTIAIPADTSLVLDNEKMFKFEQDFGLYITVGSSDTVDVIIS